MMKAVERKVRSRARQLYETRGQVDGHALEDWVKAEEEVLGNSILAPLYRRLKTDNQDASELAGAIDVPDQDSSACETRA
jgi:hypothetical protein